MKFPRIIIALSLCMPLSLCYAMEQGVKYTVNTGSTASYTIPDELVKQVADVVATRVSTDIGTSVPEWVAQLSNQASTFSADLIKQASAAGSRISNQFIKDGSKAGDDFIVKGSAAGTALVSHLTYNTGWMFGGLAVGALGAGLACIGISRYFDPERNADADKTRSHIKLTALGLGIMAATGFTVNAFLK